MTLIKFPGLIAIALFCAILAGEVTPGAAQSTYASRVQDYVNAARIENGMSALPAHAKLSQAAIIHARDMAANGFVDHTGSDESTLQDRVTRTGYPWTLVAENVAAGQKTVQEVVRDWMKSPGHKANILNTEIREIGTAHISVRKSGVGKNYNHFWVVVFGRR